MDNYNKRKGGSQFGGGKKFGSGRGGNRNFGGDRGGNRSFGGGRDRDRSDVQMYTAVCSDCNKSCEVPFKPSSDKPVFCNDCFKNKRVSRDSREPRDNKGLKISFDNKRVFQQGGGDSQNYKVQFETLNTKLDKILKILNPDITEEVEKVFADTKYKKVEKKVDTVALKEAIEKTKTKKPATKKASVKKVDVKKTTPKKAVAKKVIPKKVVAKKKK